MKSRITVTKVIKIIPFLFLLFSVFISPKLYAQKDRLGHPIFNAEAIDSIKLGEYDFISNYFTINNNISNKESSVFVSDKPSLDQFVSFSRNLPSYAFILKKKQDIKLMILVNTLDEKNEPNLTYDIHFIKNGTSAQIPCSVWGEISEKRVEELEKLKVDEETSRIDLANGQLFKINKIAYRIQPYKALHQEVIKIVQEIIKNQ